MTFFCHCICFILIMFLLFFSLLHVFIFFVSAFYFILMFLLFLGSYCTFFFFVFFFIGVFFN